MKKLTLISGNFNKTILVKENSNLLSIIQQSGLFIDAPCGGNGTCKKCTVFIDEKPRLTGGQACLACRVSVENDMIVRVPEYANLELKNEKTQIAKYFKGHCIEPAVKTDGPNNLGAAIDLGTTTICIELLELNKGKIVDSITFYNPQIIYGADIIHRIVFAQKGDNAQLLQKNVIDEIRMAINDLCLKNNFRLEDVKAAVIAGNTTMIHLAMGLPTKDIREKLYLPAPDKYPEVNILKDGKIFIIPWVANYLGGDIVSGVIASGLHKKTGINILLDIGTNGEIIIGNNEWMAGCACSAGPAFEGMGLNCGMRYKAGAVTSATYNNGKFEYSVAGESKPGGICGTGVISLLKHLREQNYIDKRGKFTDKVTDKINGRKSFILFKADDSFNNEVIYIDETDIDNILRAKAAIYSGMSLIMKKLDIPFSNINNFYIAGGIGNALNIEDALYIGLFPPMDRKKIKFIGNSSLTGAVKYLLSQEARSETYDIQKAITYLDLSSEPKYMDEYLAALFIPHTDQP
ncbi:MAG: ASKHA domain-containing protein [Elusimicrobia bacterium]|nr:ASKHA domain-containing protein [Candidatus Liberimonas magnetica]